MYFLHAINSDRQTRLLNVLGQIAMILEDKKKKLFFERDRVFTNAHKNIARSALLCRMCADI